jgi:predicted dehydrogenase
MVKVGQIGMGFMGRTHFGIYEKLPNVRVVALADQDEKRRAGSWADPIGNLPASWPAQVDMTGRKSYATLDELLADPEVEMVDITLPTWLHADAVVKALAAGKHVLSEKPMGLNAAECKKILAAYKKARTNYMVAQCIRFWPQYVTIREMIVSKKFGKLHSLALKRLANPPMYSSGNWLMNHKKSGGALLDLHVHDIDYANFVLGKPKAIYAKGTSGPSKGIDHVEALWDYGKGLIVSIEGGWCFQNAWPFEMAVLARCEKATIRWFMTEGNDIKVITDDGVKMFNAFGQEIVPGGPEAAPAAVPTGWEQEIPYFVSKVEAGKKEKEKICPPESTALSIALADAEVRSVTTGKVVPVK